MTNRDHPTVRGGFWTSQIGILLVLVLAFATLRLAEKLEINVFTGFGLLTALLVVSIGMHVFFVSARRR